MAKNKTEKRTKLSGVVSTLVLTKDSWSKEELDTAVLAKLKQIGAVINARGKTITDERVKAQNGAWLRDVKKQRNGWWCNYKFTELEDGRFSVKVA